MNVNEYLQTKEMVNNAGELVKTQRSMTIESISGYGYNPDKIKTLCTVLLNTVEKNFPVKEGTSNEETPVENSEVKSEENLTSENNTDSVEKTAEEIQEEEEEIIRRKNNLVLSLVKSKLETSFDEVKSGIITENYPKNDEIDKETEKEHIIDAFSDMLDLISTERSFDLVKSEMDTESSKLVDYLNSEEYYNEKMDKNKERKKELAELEKVQGRERNVRKIRELRQMIAVIDGQWDFSFMKENKKVTVENTVEVFFDGERSGYVVKRYYDKCAQINLNADVFRYFMNIEENNLEEKYHPFNNLFLFHCIRYMAYLDTTYNDIQFRTIVGSLTKLIYDSFPNNECKETFLNTIRTYLDKFIDAGYTDYFIEHNISYPKHPERIKKDKMREESAREYYYNIIEKALPDITFPITNEVKAMSIAELAKYAQKVLDDKKKKDEENISNNFIPSDKENEESNIEESNEVASE